MRRDWGGKIKVILIAVCIFGHIISAFSAEEIIGLEEKARELRNKGYAAQVNGQIDTAVSFYQQALTLYPGYAILYNDLGVIYEARGEFDKAVEHYLKCLEIDSACISAYSNLALLYEGKGDFSKAAQYWEKRVELGKDDDPWTVKASQHLQDLTAKLKIESKAKANQAPVIDEKKNTIEKILNKFDSSLKLDEEIPPKELSSIPEVPSDREEENIALKNKLQAYSEAMSQEKVKNNKEKAMLHEQLGTSYVKTKMYNEAVEEYKKSLTFNSNNPRIYYYLGLLYQYQRKDSKIAVECFREYLELAPYGEYNEKTRDLINILQE